jgi:hypothetical protein
VKVGDLVKFRRDTFSGSVTYDRYRQLGIILSFDQDDDPNVLWFHPSFHGQTEPNFRNHIVMLSEC